MQEQEHDHYNSPLQRSLRAEQEQREQMQRQHSGNERSQ